MKAEVESSKMYQYQRDVLTFVIFTLIIMILNTVAMKTCCYVLFRRIMAVSLLAHRSISSWPIASRGVLPTSHICVLATFMGGSVHRSLGAVIGELVMWGKILITISNAASAAAYWARLL